MSATITLKEYQSRMNQIAQIKYKINEIENQINELSKLRLELNEMERELTDRLMRNTAVVPNK